MSSEDEVQYVSPSPTGPPPLSGPPITPGERRPLWKRILLGFAPSLVLLVIMFACFALDRGGEVALPILVIAAGAYLLLTPILMVPWSIRTLNEIHGKASPDRQGARAGLVTLVTIGMTFANFFVVFAGCTAFLITLS